MECSPGQTAEDMKESTSMTRKRVKESFSGQMDGSTREAGKMESNTDFFIIALFQLALNTKLFPTQGLVPFKKATCRYFNYVRGHSITT